MSILLICHSSHDAKLVLATACHLTETIKEPIIILTVGQAAAAEVAAHDICRLTQVTSLYLSDILGEDEAKQVENAQLSNEQLGKVKQCIENPPAPNEQKDKPAEEKSKPRVIDTVFIGVPSTHAAAPFQIARTLQPQVERMVIYAEDVALDAKHIFAETLAQNEPWQIQKNVHWFFETSEAKAKADAIKSGLNGAVLKLRAIDALEAKAPALNTFAKPVVGLDGTTAKTDAKASPPPVTEQQLTHRRSETTFLLMEHLLPTRFAFQRVYEMPIAVLVRDYLEGRKNYLDQLYSRVMYLNEAPIGGEGSWTIQKKQRDVQDLFRVGLMLMQSLQTTGSLTSRAWLVLGFCYVYFSSYANQHRAFPVRISGPSFGLDHDARPALLENSFYAFNLPPREKDAKAISLNTAPSALSKAIFCFERAMINEEAAVALVCYYCEKQINHGFVPAPANDDLEAERRIKAAARLKLIAWIGTIESTLHANSHPLLLDFFANLYSDSNAANRLLPNDAAKVRQFDEWLNQQAPVPIVYTHVMQGRRPTRHFLSSVAQARAGHFPSLTFLEQDKQRPFFLRLAYVYGDGDDDALAKLLQTNFDEERVYHARMALLCRKGNFRATPISSIRKTIFAFSKDIADRGLTAESRLDAEPEMFTGLLCDLEEESFSKRVPQISALHELLSQIFNELESFNTFLPVIIAYSGWVGKMIFDAQEENAKRDKMVVFKEGRNFDVRHMAEISHVDDMKFGTVYVNVSGKAYCAVINHLGDFEHLFISDDKGAADEKTVACVNRLRTFSSQPNDIAFLRSQFRTIFKPENQGFPPRRRINYNPTLFSQAAKDPKKPKENTATANAGAAAAARPPQ